MKTKRTLALIIAVVMLLVLAICAVGCGEAEKGDPGVGIESITKSSTDGNVDTYVITYTDGKTSQFTVTNGKNGTDGVGGKDGINGTNGKSAYEIAVENGYEGTAQEWLVSLVGEQGLQGIQGIPGQKGDKGDKGDKGEYGGEPGKTAYQIYLEYFSDYDGTEQEWVEDLSEGRLKRYDITFVGGSGATGTAPEALSKRAGQKITMPENTFTKGTDNFIGWNDGNSLTVYAAGEEYTVPAKNTTLTAVWKDNKAYTRINANGEEDKNGKYILFGSYPQSKVTDTEIVSALGDFDSETWTSYGYYINGSEKNYMYYTDKNYGGEQYRGVYFTFYRPYETTISSSTENSNQDDNGYQTSTVYWFKYEPIKWKIVKEQSDDGEYMYATLVAELILDSQEYYISDTTGQISRTDYQGNEASAYGNNYQYSTIRSWLNTTFYETAFSDMQKLLIQETVVDNSVSSTGLSSNRYACANTNDKVFLLSYKEATTYFSDSTRQKKSTDYAKSQGLWTKTSSGSYFGNGYWWLRSPDYNDSDHARSVGSDGSFYSSYVSSTDGGVVPALVIRL